MPTETLMNVGILDRIARRALAQTTAMIWLANHRTDADKTDPKVGGHPAACASSLHILTALHMVARGPRDVIAGKPHAAPLDHVLGHHLGLYRHPKEDRWMDAEERKATLGNLRSFPHGGEAVFQSYHAESDPDSWRYLPSGSVGIPGVISIFLALAHRYAEAHGHSLDPAPHFWSLIGDSEFREGSLLEALPEAAERGLDNVTWILDYNRQNLDGTRISPTEAYPGSDSDRIAATMRANGWDVIELRHGALRRELFERPGGETLRTVLEELSDYELQMLLYKKDGATVREFLLEKNRDLADLLAGIDDEELQRCLRDLGGHDIETLVETLLTVRHTSTRPTMILAHTLKGWGLRMAAAPGNHSALPDQDEVEELLAEEGLSADDPFGLFPGESEEAGALETRGQALRSAYENDAQELRIRRAAVEVPASLPDTLDIDLRMTPLASTQWMLGQLIGKLTRVGAHERAGSSTGRGLSAIEEGWSPVAPFVLTLAPDVGTSTNLSPSMSGKIFAPAPPVDLERELDLVEKQRPSLTPSSSLEASHFRFEITEANTMCAVAAFGKMGDLTGLPYYPVLTIYDFFIKRALDQLYYGCYWESSFLLVGTPSGVTLSPEGAQHSWKSDLQLPGMITWEPYFAIEVDWIVSDATRRHFLGDHEDRSAVLLRCVTRGVQQRELLTRLRRQHRFTAPELSDEEVLGVVKEHVLEGGYALVDYRGSEGYEPGDNVVHLFAMGSMTTEALAASDLLLEEGIYANVFVVTSPDLLIGRLGEKDGHRHLRKTLGVNADLHISKVADRPALETPADAICGAGSRIPVVSVHDGEPGLLDNLGSLIGVRHEALAVSKASKSGTPADVFHYHGIDEESIRFAALQVLAATAMEEIVIGPGVMRILSERNPE